MAYQYFLSEGHDNVECHVVNSGVEIIDNGREVAIELDASEAGALFKLLQKIMVTETIYRIDLSNV